jgi:hypothetical protein
MRTAVLLRTEEGDAGTFGTFTTDSGLKFYCGELPWRDNKRGLSRVPSGAYECHWMKSLLHGMCYHVLGVKDRTEIEIHSANWMGDRNKINPATDLPYKCELRGCMAPGLKVGTLAGQRAVISSKDALEEFEKDMKGETFQLIIHDIPAPEIVPGFHGGVD